MRPMSRVPTALREVTTAYAGAAYAVTDWTVLVTCRNHGAREVIDGGRWRGGGGNGGEPESSDSLRTFGAVVQGLREHAGLSREEFGELVRFSKHTVASVELGRRMPDPVFVERAEEVFGRTGALRKAAGCLERQPGLAAWFRRWSGPGADGDRAGRGSTTLRRSGRPHQDPKIPVLSDT
ncbi:MULTISPECIES: helix-turn-helix domain-containing protein [Streptomyces]|uniref:helix-turn-helix domain-containing protein n=1 Tax=Streptomyces TaxID=1883 RepID=UPI003B8A7DFD